MKRSKDFLAGMEEAAKIAEQSNSFTGASYCDGSKDSYDSKRAHDYGRGGCDARRAIAENIRATIADLSKE
jgi:hypothetical protein